MKEIGIVFRSELFKVVQKTLLICLFQSKVLSFQFGLVIILQPFMKYQKKKEKSSQILNIAVVPRQKGIVKQRKDRKSTRLNSSHVSISYAVFCLKKKTNAAAHHSSPERSIIPHCLRL